MDFQIARDKTEQGFARLATSIPHFKPRQSQWRMAEAIQQTLDPEQRIGARIAVIEAPTGTGKSIAYLLSAIPAAQALEKTVVVSTATIALQQQLIDKDLPELAQKAGLDFSYRIAKGRGRYACLRNLADMTGSDANQEALDLGQDHEAVGSWARQPQQHEIELVNALEKAAESGRWDGDLDQWSDPIQDDLRAMLVTSNAGCSGRACPFFNDCPFFKARAGLREADVVIANHDLVLADLALGGGAILTDPEETIYVFDEAHHLSDKAVNQLSFRSPIASARKTLENATKLARAGATLLKTDKARGQADKLQSAVSESLQAMAGVRRELENAFPEPKKPARFRTTDTEQTWSFHLGRTPEAFIEPGKRIALSTATVLNCAKEILEALKEAVKKGTLSNDQTAKPLQNLGYAIDRIDEMSRTWSHWSNVEPAGTLPMARWVFKAPGNAQDIGVAVSSISAAQMLRTHLWDRSHGAILTSATLTALNRFDRLQRSAGLAQRDGTQYIRLDSPFDFAAQGVLEVPRMDNDPSAQREAHTQEVANYLNAQIDPQAGSLVLFASRAQMNQVTEQLSPTLRAITLIQGEASRTELLERHESAIRAGKGSLIFGLASFAEGVDLKGELCTHVVIAKIPFAVPDSPVEQTRTQWLEARGVNAFMFITVPDASLKLIQAVGRLIRSESDTGTVTILDRRLVTKRFGQDLLNSLPPMARDIEYPDSAA